MILSLIAAMAENRVIGIKQKLPWDLPADLKRFRALTKGHPCVMGRKTFDSIGHPLPNRPNIMVSRQKGLAIEGVKVVSSVAAALESYLKSDEEVFILGGGELFDQTWRQADRLYLTVIHQQFEGDAFFPAFDPSLFKVTFQETHQEPLPYEFINYERRGAKTPRQK